MASIFASKLFITSPRQKEIRAAIQNPINKELVKQLASYVDFDEPSTSTSEATPSQGTATQAKPSEPSAQPQGTHGAPVGNGSTPTPPANDDVGGNSQDPFDDGDTTEHTSEDTAPQTTEDSDYNSDDSSNTSEGATQPASQDMEDQDQSHLNASTAIKATTFVPDDSTQPNQFSDLADVVKGQLNAEDDSKGVTRVTLKNNEIWVYFNDDVNLNNVLTPVLEHLNSADFSWMNFNRLARSNNAIVFTTDSENAMKPETEVNPKDFPGIDKMQKDKKAKEDKVK